jgi:putative ABC transport system permease protein
MTSLALAWRTAVCYRMRSLLAMAGVAIIGALLFDMLLLSRGLVDSFADLLNSSGFDVRVVAQEGLPVLRAPIREAARLAVELRALPEVEDVMLVRIEQAVLADTTGKTDKVAIIGSTRSSVRSAWTLLQGSDLPEAADSRLLPDARPLNPQSAIPIPQSSSCPLIVGRHLAEARAIAPGATLTIRLSAPHQASALPPVACRVLGIADFAFANATDYSVATTMSALAAADTMRPADEADLVLVRSRPQSGGRSAARAIARVRPELHAYSNEEIVADFNQNGFAYFRQVSIVLSSVTLVFTFLLVGTLLTVSTNQRLGEIAALRALGIGRGRIAAMLLWESGVLVGAGALLALPLGGLLAWRLDRLLRQMPGLPERLHFFVFNSGALVEHALLLAATAIVAASYPIWLAARLPIAETLRREVVG